ncbi:MAG: alpha/beta hydrolase [Burkholderiales bacterium]|nr:alpha/beta hydrolase [Burkholderiales bacterium]
MPSHPEVTALQQRASVLHTPCGDGTLVWHRWGTPSQPPLLLLHGGSGSWTHWVRNIDALAAAGWQVLVPDMPGFGDSAAPPDGHDADVLPGWLEQGLHALLGPQPVACVGFSFGGLVAGLWAQAQPARLARLVLVGCPGLSAELLPPLPLQRWDSLPPGPARTAAHRHNLLTLMLARPESATPLAVALHAANVERDRLRRRRLMLTDALCLVLPTLRCPLHGIWGGQDVLYRHRLPLVQQVLSTAPGFGGLQVLPDAGHWVQFEAADAFNAALAGALSTYSAQAP